MNAAAAEVICPLLVRVFSLLKKEKKKKEEISILYK